MEVAKLVWFKGAANDRVLAGLNVTNLGNATPSPVVLAVDYYISASNCVDSLAIAMDEFDVHVNFIVHGFEKKADASSLNYSHRELWVC